MIRRRKILKTGNVLVKSTAQMEGIRESGKINTYILDYVQEHICAGVSTGEIDRWVSEQTALAGAVPAPLNYEGFPKSVCTSRNHAVCHGIPSDGEILKEGDIINVDVSTIYKGFFSDSSRMFCIGEVSADKKTAGAGRQGSGAGGASGSQALEAHRGHGTCSAYVCQEPGVFRGGRDRRSRGGPAVP